MNLVALKAEFERCWPWMRDSLREFGPTHTKDQVWERICTGRAFMWPGKASVIVGEIVAHPIGYRSFNYWLQGGALEELVSRHPEIEDWAREAGCARVTGRGRDGWSRAMRGEWQRGPSTRMKWLGDIPRSVRDFNSG